MQMDPLSNDHTPFFPDQLLLEMWGAWSYRFQYTINSQGVNLHSKDITQVQQQRPESLTVSLTCHACKYKVHKLHHRYILTGSNTVQVGTVIYVLFW